MVTIKEVTSKKELKKFVDFPNQLYKNEPNFVPALFGDDMSDWDRKKNPAFEYCDAKCFLAYRDGKIVGRIGAILNHASNQKWGTNQMRFSQVDFIDDHEVSSSLFAAVEKWAKECNCEKLHGPLGFCDLDREGMLVEGFDKRSMFITYYNYPYYNEHLEKLGFAKDVDWLEYKVYRPEADSKEAAFLKRLSDRTIRHQNLHVAKIKHRREYYPYVEKVFKLVNEAYAPLYGVVELNEKQIKRYAKKFIPLINPAYTCFVMDENENMVAFGVSAPSMAEALKASRGRLFPTGWIGVLRSLNKNNALDMFLIAVNPNLQSSGLNAVILNHVFENALKNGIEYAETGPQLEINTKILTQWNMFRKEQHKRRRCYIKNID